jgi:hypothetical protein
MTKLGEKLERGILREKDLGKALRSDLSQEAFDLMKKSWKFDVPLPQIKVVINASEGLSDYESGCIELSPSSIQGLWDSYRRVGMTLSAEDFLRSIIAQNFSLYALHKANSKVFDCDFDLEKPEEQTIEDFKRFISVYTQISSVGEIGSRIMERQLGVCNIQKTKEAICLDYIDFEKIDKDVEEYTAFASFARIMTAAPKSKDLSEGKNLRKLNEEDIKYLEQGLQLALGGTTVVFIADDVENAYNGRFPQLMKEKFSINDVYVNHFNKFVGTYMPTFGKNLDRTLSRLKP